MNFTELVGNVVLGNAISIKNIKTGNMEYFKVSDVQVLVDLVKANNGDINIPEEKVYNYLHTVSLCCNEVVLCGEEKEKETKPLTSQVEYTYNTSVESEKPKPKLIHEQPEKTAEDLTTENIDSLFGESTDTPLEVSKPLTTKHIENKLVDVSSTLTESVAVKSKSSAYLDRSKISKLEFARSRYYMLVNRLRNNKSMRWDKNLKFLSRNDYVKLYKAYEDSNESYVKLLQSYVGIINKVIRKNLDKRKDSYKFTEDYYKKHMLTYNELNTYVRKSMDIMNFIVDNMKPQYSHLKDRPSELITRLVTDDTLYTVEIELDYPIDVRYKHLKKKLNFNTLYLCYEILTGDASTDEKDKALSYIFKNILNLVNKLRLLNDALQNSEGIHYLVKAFGLHDLKELINALANCKVKGENIDVPFDSAYINSPVYYRLSELSSVISKIETSFNNVLNGINISDKYLDYWNGSHRDVCEMYEPSKVFNPIRDVKVSSASQQQEDADYVMPIVGESSQVNENTNTRTYENGRLSYLTELNLTSKEFAKNRYYMMYNRFMKSSSNSVRVIKFMSFDDFGKLLCGKLGGDYKFKESVNEFIMFARNTFKRKYRNLAQTDPKKYARLNDKLNKELTETNVMSYVNKGIKIIEFIRDNLLSEKDRQRCGDNLYTTFSHLCYSSKYCSSLEDYPEVIKYKHLKKKLNFKRIRVNLDRLINSDDSDLRKKAYKCLTDSLPIFLDKVRLLNNVLYDETGRKYLAKAYDLQELSDMILDLSDIRNSYIQKLIRESYIGDISLGDFRPTARVLNEVLVKTERIYNMCANYFKTDNELIYLNSQHVNTKNKSEDFINGNNNISEWI